MSCFGSLTIIVYMTWLWTSHGSPLLLRIKQAASSKQNLCVTLFHCPVPGCEIFIPGSTDSFLQNYPSDMKVEFWLENNSGGHRSNYAGLVYDLSAHIHYPQLQNSELPFNFSFQLAHHFPYQVVMSEWFNFFRFLGGHTISQFLTLCKRQLPVKQELNHQTWNTDKEIPTQQFSLLNFQLQNTGVVCSENNCTFSHKMV